MIGYNQVSLKDMITQLGEEKTKEILSDFLCPHNKDVEKFLKINAIVFAQQNIAPTHLIFASYKGEMRLIAYFTLTIKNFFISRKSLSNTLRRKVAKFGTYNKEMNGYYISAPLIAQLGKNFNDNLNTLIPGDELLKLACDKIAKIQQDVGGKIAYVECEDKPVLIDFYTSNGFVNFGRRDLDNDEKDDLSGSYLMQMLRYLNG